MEEHWQTTEMMTRSTRIPLCSRTLPLDQRVLVLAPFGRDADEICRVLADAGINAERCANGEVLCEEIRYGAAAAVLAEEALDKKTRESLVQTLEEQPAWSDFPLLLMTLPLRGRSNSWEILQDLDGTGHLNLLDRPLHISTLVSAVSTATRSRERQYQIRDAMAAQKSAEEALRKSSERLQLAQRAGRVGVFEWIIPEDHVQWDPELRALYEIPNGAAYKNLHEWYTRIVPEDRARIKEGIEACLREKQTTFDDEFRILLPDGTHRWLAGQARFYYGETGEPLRMIGVHYDINNRKHMEEALRSQEKVLREINRTLEQRVEQRTKALEKRNYELQQFAYVASHDMQEPLRKIQTFADLTRSDFAEQLGDEGLFYLDRMQNAAARMTQILQDLLAFSRVATHQQPFTWTSVGAVMDIVLADLDLVIEKTGATIEVDADVTLKADVNQLRQLLNHLVMNAIKFRRDNVPLIVRVTADRSGGEKPLSRLIVEDNGIGFDEKYADRIFQPFERLHPKADYPGTGMGLAICRRIVERHGGTIRAESRPGKGSRFIVELPVSK